MGSIELKNSFTAKAIISKGTDNLQNSRKFLQTKSDKGYYPEVVIN